jgi:hypothetical protein
MIAFLLVKVNTGEEAIYSQREKKKLFQQIFPWACTQRVKNKIDTIWLNRFSMSIVALLSSLYFYTS